MFNTNVWEYLNLRYGGGVSNTIVENSCHLLHNRNALVAVRKAVRTVKLCINEILTDLNCGCGIIQVQFDLCNV